MRKYINDYVSTLSFRQQRRAYAVLDDARVEKSQVSVIASKLSNEGVRPTLQLREEDRGSVITAPATNAAFRDAFTRLEDLYNTSNNIDLLLNSNISILTADLKGLDDELTALEKSVANYSFLLSDGGSYDYAFLESFSDSRNREDGFDFLIPDRGGLVFSDGDNATVLADEGTIALPQNTVRTYPLRGVVLQSNAGAFVTSSTDIKQALNTQAGTGWRMSVAAPAPITSQLPEFSKLYTDVRRQFNGFNTVIELYLPSPSPCDSLKLSPFAGHGIEVAQIEMYEDLESTNKKALLDVPVVLDSEKNFYFDLQPVSKFKLYLSQTNYTRDGIEPLSSEERYRKIANSDDPLNRPINIHPVMKGENEKTKVSFISRLVQKYLGATRGKKYNVSFPESLHTPHWLSDKEDLTKIFTNHRHPNRRWNNSTAKSALIEEIIVNRLPVEIRDAFLPRIIRGGQDSTLANRPNIYPVFPVRPRPPVSGDWMQSQRFKYQYTMGLKTIVAGNSISGLKGVFVSKILPSPGDVGEVRIKVHEEHFMETPTDRDQPRLTAIEYSVSNQAKPHEETDWAAILPVGSGQVIAERFMPDQIGKGLFRFPANLEANIIMYKNGHEVNDLDINTYLMRSSTRQTAIGIKLPLGYATPQDIFTVDYTPAGDPTVVNFEAAGYETPPLVSSFDEDGAGEGYLGTNGQLIIDLLYEPYINYEKVEASTYVPNFGLSGYNPVIVILQDGTTALNLTNYQGGDQSVLNPASGTSFIQNGTSLMFNKAISQSFRVYYQYLPNNLRFRVVLRSNSDKFVSPKVDVVQVKAKTRKADPKRT